RPSARPSRGCAAACSCSRAAGPAPRTRVRAAAWPRESPGRPAPSAPLPCAEGDTAAGPRTGRSPPGGLERELHPLVRGDEPEPLVEAVGVGAPLVGGELHERAAAAPRLRARPADHPPAQA